MADGWITPDSDWIARPVDRDARYTDALRSLRRPCDCPDGCESRRRWLVMVDGTLDAWLLDRERMGERHG